MSEQPKKSPSKPIEGKPFMTMSNMYTVSSCYVNVSRNGEKPQEGELTACYHHFFIKLVKMVGHSLIVEFQNIHKMVPNDYGVLEVHMKPGFSKFPDFTYKFDFGVKMTMKLFLDELVQQRFIVESEKAIKHPSWINATKKTERYVKVINRCIERVKKPFYLPNEEVNINGDGRGNFHAYPDNN